LAEAYFARGLVNRCRGRVEKALADLRRYVELATDAQRLADAKELIAELEATISGQ
jgi:tetratricopeptide (TPR) repeat protein